MIEKPLRAQEGRLHVGQVVFVLLVTSTLAFIVIPAWCRARREAWRTGCVGHLTRIYMAMTIYLHERGNDQWYPCPLGRGRNPGEFNGAEWLASLYWTGTVPDPGVFLCPASGDTNDDGIHIGSTRTTPSFGSQTVSYAGMHWRSVSASGSAIEDIYPHNEPMASDDTQGTINHGTGRHGGMNVLFFDSHVEFKTNTELDLERAVGRKGGLLEKLRN